MEAPIHDESVLFCRHAVISGEEIHMHGPIEWYRPSGGSAKVKTPEGEEFTVRFIALCQECHLAAKGTDPMKFVRKHGFWFGDSPKIDRIQ